MTTPWRRHRWASRVPLVVLVLCLLASSVAGAVGAGSVVDAGAPSGPPQVDGVTPARAARDVKALVSQFGIGPLAAKQSAVQPIQLPPVTTSTPVGGVAPSSSPSPASSGSTAALSGAASGPPAPLGFRRELIGLYGQAAAITAAASHGLPAATPVQSPPSTTQFAQAVDALTPADLRAAYDATRKVPGFDGTAQVLADVLAAQNGNVNPVRSLVQAGSAVRPEGAGASPEVSGPVPHASPGTGITFTPATTETTDPSLNVNACPPGAGGGDYGEDAIYALNLAVDAYTITTSFVPQSLVQGDYVLGEGVTITLPDPAWVAVELGLMAVQIARDTLVWQQAIAADCASNSLAALIGVVYDNVNSLIGLVDSRTTAIDNEEQLLYALVDARTTLILNKIAVLQASLNLELKVTIEEDLLQGANGSVADFEIPASAGGYLNATPIGVQSLVTNALATTEQAGQSVNPAAPGDLAAANAALAAQQYKQAFQLYGQAYREIVQ